MSEYYDDLWEKHYDKIYGKTLGSYEFTFMFEVKNERGFYRLIARKPPRFSVWG